MRRSSQKAGLLALAAHLSVASAACAAGVTDSEIVIGTHLGLSGPVAAAMPPIRNGMQMRIDEANEAGGVNGRKLRLVVEDNAYQPGTAVRAVQKLTREDRVFAILNAFGSGPNAAAIKLAADSGTIYFAPWGASAVFHLQSGRSPLVFTTIPNYDSTTAAGLSWIIRNWNMKRIGVIYQDDAFGELLRRGVKVALEAAELKPAAEASYRPGAGEFSTQVSSVRQAGAEVVVLAAATREVIGIMAQVKNIGWTDARVLATLPGRTQFVARLGRNTLEGLYGIGAWRIVETDSADPRARSWIESFRSRFGTEPDENAALAYSYADWFVQGLQAAGRDLTTDSFIKAMQGFEHVDFIGYAKTSFKNNHISPEVVRIEQVRRGRWVSVSPDIVPGSR